MSAAELHRQLEEKYESDTKSSQQVAKRCRTFACVRDSVTNDNLSGRYIFLAAEVNSARVEDLLQLDRRATSCRLSSGHGCSMAPCGTCSWMRYRTLTSGFDGCFVPKLKVDKNDYICQFRTTLCGGGKNCVESLLSSWL